MKFIVDANILIAAPISKGITRNLLLLKEKIELFVPEQILEEIEKHLPEIPEKMHLDGMETKNMLTELPETTEIKIIKFADFIEFAAEAEKITPDKDDMHYFALSLKLDCPLWSNDKKLKQQSKVKIYSTQEILELLK